MNYQETLDYLYNSVPMFQQVGSSAYKEGLENTYALDEYLGHPHTAFQSIHIAGTNGKGSCSHTLAAILQSAGYRVGLYTSPHLVDFPRAYPHQWRAHPARIHHPLCGRPSSVF